MSFWNKNKLPAEFKDLNEDQMTELLTKGKTAEQEAKDAKLAAETAAAAQQKAEKEAKELREQLAARPQPNKEEPPPLNNNNVNNNPPSDADWLTNPNDAFNRQSAPLTALALHSAMMSARLMADNYIRQQGPLEARLWNKYQKEVFDLVDKMEPAHRTVPQTYLNQFTYVKGCHVNDIVKEGQRDGDAFFSETAGPTGHGLPDPAKSSNDTLTAQEESTAKRYGIKSEDYLKRKKELKFGPAA